PKIIKINLIGDRLSDDEINLLETKAMAGLDNTQLQINQSGGVETDMSVLRSDILKDLYERNEQLIQDKDTKIALLEREVANYSQVRALGSEIAEEAKINHPNLKKFTLNRSTVR